MAAASPGRNHQDTLELWRSKLQEARVQYSLAVKKSQQASRKSGLFRSHDSGLAIEQAQREEAAALQEYMRTLVIFADFPITGQPPPEA